MILHVYTDGGARGNPGPAAIGFVVKEVSFVGTAEILRNKCGKKIGVSTNNVAEYTAVLEALNYLLEVSKTAEVPTEKIEFFLDSQLVASQLAGKFKIKNPNLARLFVLIKQKESMLPAKIYYQYIPREQNSLADKLVNQALDS